MTPNQLDMETGDIIGTNWDFQMCSAFYKTLNLLNMVKTYNFNLENYYFSTHSSNKCPPYKEEKFATVYIVFTEKNILFFFYISLSSNCIYTVNVSD